MKLGRTQVLGNFQPTRLDRRSIQNELLCYLGTFVIKGSMPEVRDPLEEGHDDPVADNWHQDNGGADFHFVVWANRQPTEVRFRNGRKLRAKDGDVILIHNSMVKHRRPLLRRSRWFARVTVQLFTEDNQ